MMDNFDMTRISRVLESAAFALESDTDDDRKPIVLEAADAVVAKIAESAAQEPVELQSSADVSEEDSLARKASELMLLKAQKKELEDKIAEIENVFKTAMDAEGVEVLEVGDYKARYSQATRTGVDNKKLQKDLPDIWEKYLKVTKYRRFELKLK